MWALAESRHGATSHAPRPHPHRCCRQVRSSVATWCPADAFTSDLLKVSDNILDLHSWFPVILVLYSSTSLHWIPPWWNTLSTVRMWWVCFSNKHPQTLDSITKHRSFVGQVIRGVVSILLVIPSGTHTLQEPSGSGWERNRKHTSTLNSLDEGSTVLLFILCYKELVLWPQLNCKGEDIMIFPRAQGREIIRWTHSIAFATRGFYFSDQTGL